MSVIGVGYRARGLRILSESGWWLSVANYRGGTGYGGRSYHEVARVVGGQSMQGDVFGALGQLNQVSGAAVSGAGSVGVGALPSPLQFSGLQSGNVSLAGLPSSASIAGMVPPAPLGAGTGGLDPSVLLAQLPPEAQAYLLQQILGMGTAGGSGVDGMSGAGTISESGAFEALGRRLIEILLSQGGLEKLMGLRSTSAGGSGVG